jgi:hypothetical protein
MTPIDGRFSEELKTRSTEAEELIACLGGLTQIEKTVVSVICGTLMAVEAEHGAAGSMAVVEQITMVLGARRLGDG